MTNRSDEPVPGVRVTAAPMMHSMDFHAAMVSPQDKYRSIAPGQTIEFEFTLNYPGVFMYHCGTPMILEHIASGMYGMMIVEPRDGYPTKVDREYAVIQSEFYAKPDPHKRKVDGAPLYVLDAERLRAKAPTYTVFNGRTTAWSTIRCRRSPASACACSCSTSARARPRASTSSARSSTASGSKAIRTTSSAACRPCCSARRTARSSSS